MVYDRRIVDDALDELLGDLPAVSLDGPKGVGKTATASRRAQTTFRLDDALVRELVAADPTRIDAVPGTVLLDEWQRLPAVWDHVRRAVDDGAPPGRYLLTGSAAPTTSPTHSGAGRIVSLRLRPMSLAERGLAVATVSLSDLLSGRSPQVGGQSTLTLADYVEQILASGLPGLRGLRPIGRQAQLSGYLDRVVERDFAEQGARLRRPQVLRSWLTAYAAATATTTSYNALLAAATPGESDKPAKTTTIAYRDVLSQLWLLDPVPGWIPGRNHLTRLGQAPKHHLADPALAASLLGAGPESLLAGKALGPTVARDGTLLGALFESLVTLSARVYAQRSGATTWHLRTTGGEHEVDLILQRPDGRVVALEVKLGGTVDDRDVRHLHWLSERLGDTLLDAAVVTTGPHAYRRPDGIAVVPAALLGP